MSLGFHIYSPSYKRSKLACSHKLFDRDVFTYVINEDEAKQYSRLDRNLMIIPMGVANDIAQTRNYILNNAPEKHLIMVDDDIKSINHVYKREWIELSWQQLHHQIVMMYQLCEQLGSGIWGMNMTDDRKAYKITSPLSFKQPVLGPFTAHIKDELRYDENLHLKEDYDFFLQKVNKYGLSLRANYMCYKCDHEKMSGGCQEYRTPEIESEQKSMFKRKWGTDIIRDNEKRKNSINVTVRL